jgi:hypothetical protein
MESVKYTLWAECRVYYQNVKAGGICGNHWALKGQETEQAAKHNS